MLFCWWLLLFGFRVIVSDVTLQHVTGCVRMVLS